MLDSAPKSNDVISHHRDNSKGVICNYFANKIRIPHHGLGDVWDFVIILRLQKIRKKITCIL